jgi:hypothetical protein
LDIFFGHLVYFVVIWYFPPILVSCTKKNLATLLQGFRGRLLKRCSRCVSLSST